MLLRKYIRRFWIPLLAVLIIFQELCSQQNPAFTIEPEYLGVRSGFPAVIPYNIVKRPKVALVLSGGGARGMAAIGILRVLERHNIPLDLVVGTSVGAIVGGLYASGYSADNLEKILTTTNWDELLALTDDTRRRDMFFDKKQIEDRSLLVLRFSNFEPVIPPALSTGQRLTNFLNLLVLNSLYRSKDSFDSLKVAFRAVSTDLITGQRVVIKEGDMTEALRAAVAIPLLFTPVMRDSMQLLDGGLVSNIPIDVARSYGADIIIGADMSSPLRPSDKLTAPWEQADQIMGIMMQLSNQMQLRNADVVIRPELGSRLASDFSMIGETVARGEEAATAKIPEIRSLIDDRTFSNYGNGSESALLTGVRLQFPEGFDPIWSGRLYAAMQGDTLALYSVQRWLAALYGTGDYRAVRFEGEIAGGFTNLRLELENYPILTDIKIEGATLIETDTLAIHFLPLVGKPINHHRLAHATELVLHDYRRSGYALAALEHAGIDLLTGSLRLRIREGLVDRLVITGTQKTKDYVIWRELPFDRWEVFQIEEAKQGLDNIYATNLFEQVAYDFERTPEGEQLVVIKARERYSSLLRFGMKIDDERYAQGSLDARDENFLGIGAELGARIAGGSRNIFVMGEFKATRLFDSYFTMTLRGYLDQRQVNTYDYSPGSRARTWSRERTGEFRQLKQGGLLSFGTQLERLGNLTIESRIERHLLSNLFNTPVAVQDYSIAQLRAAIRLDTQDKVPFADAGVIADLYLESPLAKIENSVGFTRFFVGYESFHTPFSGHTVHPKLQFGFADATMPESEFFSLGGQQSFFGFREDDQRGRQMFLASLEYRYRIPFVTLLDLYTKIRYDLGTTWAVVENIRLRDMRHGIGLTLAANTPVGPMEVSLAKGFYFKDEFDRPVTFGPLLVYFTLGFNL